MHMPATRIIVRYSLLGLALQLAFIASAGLFARAAIADVATAPDTTAHVVGTWPTDIAAIAEPIAETYIAEHGWTDRCQGIPPVALLADNLDTVAGSNVDGLTFEVDCTFYGDATAVASAPERACAVFVHERLHNARGDSYHNTTDPTDPLYAADSDGDGIIDSGSTYLPCVQAFTPASFTWGQARRAVRAQLRHAARWRLEPMDWTQADSTERLCDVRFVVRRRGHRRDRRVYVVTRPEKTMPVKVSRRR